MTLTSGQIIFAGGGLLVLLLGAYALYEWALVVLDRCTRSSWSEQKAQLLFGLPATLVAFLPCVFLAVLLAVQPAGGDGVIINTREVAVVFLFFAALLAGMVVEFVAMVAFSVALGRRRK